MVGVLLLPFPDKERLFSDSELFLLAVIANLVFFHTLSRVSLTVQPVRTLLRTVLMTAALSSVMYGAYSLYLIITS